MRHIFKDDVTNLDSVSLHLTVDADLSIGFGKRLHGDDAGHEFAVYYVSNNLR